MGFCEALDRFGGESFENWEFNEISQDSLNRSKVYSTFTLQGTNFDLVVSVPKDFQILGRSTGSDQIQLAITVQICGLKVFVGHSVFVDPDFFKFFFFFYRDCDKI